MFNLKNKKIVIIGGSGLIGRPTIIKLLNEGAKVINVDLKDFIKKKKNYKFHKLNCTLVDFYERFSKIILDRFNPEVVINCSYPKTKDWEKNDFKNFAKTSFSRNTEYHFNSYFLFSKKIADHMKKKKIRGSIILLSSIYGFLGQNQFLYKGTSKKENLTYSIIKGSLINFVRQMCAYYAQYNIKINSISPGGIEDRSMSKMFKKKYSEICPSKRLGKPEEIASVILFLSSNTSSYINGSNIVVDGGFSII